MFRPPREKIKKILVLKKLDSAYNIQLLQQTTVNWQILDDITTYSGHHEKHTDSSDLSTWRNPYLTQFFPQAMADAQNSMP